MSTRLTSIDVIDHLPVDLACNDLQFDAPAVRLIGACSDRQVCLWAWQPMTNSTYGHWSHIPRGLGPGMRPGTWEQSFICSTARFVDEEQVISSWFDGSERLFTLSYANYRSDHVASFGETSFAGWAT